MCVGPKRLYEAMATLSFDFRIKTPIEQTVMITPYNHTEVKTALNEFNIDSSKFEILSDKYFDEYYDLSKWSHDNWYKQQAFKLCSLDHFNATQFLIQDADIILLKDYYAFIDNEPNFKAEDLWNNYHTVYAECVAGLIGLNRNLNKSLVNELMPYYKNDWIQLKEVIEDKHKTTWVDAIPNYKKFDNSKWFSEYELLGIWKTNQQRWRYFSHSSQPPVNSWDDFYNINWTEFSAIKFHSQPLKFMTKLEAKRLVEFINETIS